MTSVNSFRILVGARGEGVVSVIADIARHRRDRKSKAANHTRPLTTKDTKERKGKPLKTMPIEGRKAETHANLG